MQEITIDTLTLENFKGFKRFTFSPNSKDVLVRGPNASKKTTILDSYLWDLFGKNSSGDTDFKFRPLDKNNMAVRGVIVAVELVLIIDGQKRTLRREQHEKIVNEQMEGYYGVYAVDGVPVSMGEYKAAVAAIISEELFRMLTDIDYFCGKLHWKVRREMLMKLPTSIPTPQGFEELIKAADGREMQDYKAALVSRRLKYKDKRDEIPTRLDELQQDTVAPMDMDVKAFETDRDAVMLKLEEMAVSRSALIRARAADEAKRVERQQKLTTLLRSKIDREAILKAPTTAMLALNTEEQELVTAQTVHIVKERQLTHEWEMACIEVQSCQKQVTASQESLAGIRAQYLSRKKVTTDTTCYACGLPLAAEKLKENIETQKAELSEIATSGESLKLKAKTHKGTLAIAQAKVTACLEAIEQADELKKTAAEKSRKRMLEITAARKTPAKIDFATDGEWVAINTSMEQLDTELSAVKSYVELESLEAEKTQAEVRINELNTALSGQDQAKKDAARKVELETEQRTLSQHIASIDKELVEIDAYTVQESLSIELAVNEKFKYIQFHLFEYRQNGMVNDQRCDATLNGVPYSDMSTGESRAAGANCIEVFSNHYKLKVPLFIDNFESVTLPIEIDTQLITLEATKKVKKLTVTYKE